MSNLKEEADAFAIAHGFDGAMELPDSFPPHYFEAGFHHPESTCAKWTPMFDNTPHIIVVDEDGARWRSERDAITLFWAKG